MTISYPACNMSLRLAAECCLRRAPCPSRSLYTPYQALSSRHIPPRASACSRWNHSTPSKKTAPLEALLTGNKSWADSTRKAAPDLLPTLAKGQSPKVLWLGCADSRVPETTILNLQPGDVFVHRNIANIITSTDLSALAVIEYAVVYLGVQHIVVCGHSKCGGVAAALGNKRLGKIDAWLMPLRHLRMKHRKELEACASEDDKGAAMVELNVKQSVEVVRENPDVIEAAKERGLTVHGLVYDLGSGELREVDCADDEEAAKSRLSAFAVVA